MGAELAPDWFVERERRRTLARLLNAPEAVEAAWPGKPAAEPELLRTGYGACDNCAAPDVLLHRFDIDPGHVALLYCQCDGADERYATSRQWICVRHATGTHPDGAVFGGEAVECDIESNTDGSWCRIAHWLTDDGHVPWLCPRCWRAFTDDETAHLTTASPEP